MSFSSLCLGFRRELIFISLLFSFLPFCPQVSFLVGTEFSLGFFLFSGTRFVFPSLSFGRHGNAFFACGQVVDWVDQFLCPPLLGGRFGFKPFSLRPLVLQVFTNCLHAINVVFRDEGVRLTRFLFLGISSQGL